MDTNTFKVGEMLNKRSPFSKTWMNFDGSYTTELFQTLVHFEDADGNLHNISVELHDEADLFDYCGPLEVNGKEILEEAKERAIEDIESGKLNRDNYDFQGVAVPFKARIPRNFISGYEIGQGADTLKFTPIGASPSKGYLDNKAKNCIHYQDAWNDADVCLELKNTGIKETIVLKTDRAPSAFSFEVSGTLEDDLTSGNLKLQPAWLQDANGEKRDVTQTIRREGEDTFIDLVADVSGLVYPIEIDPTVIIQPSTQTGKDAYVGDGYPNRNNGNDYELMSLLDKVGDSSNFYGVSEIFIQLDVSSIPRNAEIKTAIMTLTTKDTGNGSARNFELRGVTAPWSENTITWNNKPAVESTVTTTTFSSLPSARNVCDFDVKPLVSRWVSGSLVNNGLKIQQTTANGGTGAWVRFFSSENNVDKPRLTITYNEPPTTPTVTAPNGGETWNSVHTVTWTSATDPLNDSGKLSIKGTGDIGMSAGFLTAGQVFKVTSTDVIYRVGIDFGSSDTYTLRAGTTVTLRDYNTTNDTRGTIRASGTVPKNVTEPGYVYVTLDTPTSFPIGTVLAVEFSNASQIGSNPIASSNAGYTDGYAYSIVSTGQFVKYATYDLHLDVFYGSYSALKYQIQLSSNNGSTWKDIASLTNAGVTSYQYDFINEAESSLSKIRIRAYDGAVYGPWDESNGVFTIVHNQAPSMPTNLSPRSTIVDKAVINRFSWKHNDPNGTDPQSKFDLQWRLQGDSTWTTVTQTTTNNYYDMPANTLPIGLIEWQVRTYDQAGLSGAYATIAVFNVANKPATPTIVTPTNGAIVPIANPVIQWSHPSQTDYWVRILDVAGTTTLFEDKKTSLNKAITLSYNLANQTGYKIQVAVKDSYGLWSDFTTVNVTVSYTPPAIPVLNVTEDNKRGSIAVSIINPTPAGTEPKVLYNDVYRKENNGSFIRVAEKVGVNSIFVDYTPLPKATIAYYVIAYGDNGTFVNSSVISTIVSVSHTQISSISNPNMVVSLQKRTDGTETNSIESEKMRFAGRAYPMTEFGTQMERAFEYSYKVFSLEEMFMIRELASIGETLLLRDNRGHKDYVTISSITIVEKPILWEINIKPEKVYYVEGV